MADPMFVNMICFCAGTLFGVLLGATGRNIGSSTADGAKSAKGKSASFREEYKLLLIVRKDLKMGGGKVAAQCCHATLGAVEKVSNDTIKFWRRTGEAKVTRWMV